MTSDQLEEYLDGPEWAVLSRLAMHQADGACQVCNATRDNANLGIYHRSGERIGEELLSDLAVLCDPCLGLCAGKDMNGKMAYHQNRLAWKVARERYGPFDGMSDD